jgi:transcription initiation factor TFIIE subunit alpha
VNHIQKEGNPQQRLITRTYFYIHITEAIDLIKWKVHSVVNTLKTEMLTLANPQGYVCPRCGKKVNQLDAISLLSEDKTEFICDVCHGVLIEDDSSQQASIRQLKLEKLMNQLDPIITYLKKIDDSIIEDNDFEMALTKAIPAQTQTTATYALSNRVPANGAGKSMYTSGQQSEKSQATLHVSITANDENYERELQEKEQRRLKLEQNALPSWHSGSTVGKSSLGKLDDDENESSVVSSNDGIKMEQGDGNESEDIKPSIEGENTSASTLELKDKEGQDALAAYYAELAEREAQEEEDDDDDDNDDSDEFDDIL